MDDNGQAQLKPDAGLNSTIKEVQNAQMKDNQSTWGAKQAPGSSSSGNKGKPVGD